MSAPGKQAERRASSPPPFLLVTGGKGGVGKTTVAANLGLALAQAGARPVLVDLDFALANLDVMLGLRAERTVEDFFAGGLELSDCLVPVPCSDPGGMRFLGAGSGSYRSGRPDPSARSRLRQSLAGLDAELVVGDAPAGIGAELLDFAVTAERVLVVTTPEPAAATDAFGVIKALDAYACDHGREAPTPEIFVNLASHAAEARGVASKLASVCERFLSRSPRFAGWMPRSTRVLRAGIDQRPFVLGAPESSAARSLHRLASRYLPLGAQPGRAAPLGAPRAVAKASLDHGR